MDTLMCLSANLNPITALLCHYCVWILSLVSLKKNCVHYLFFGIMEMHWHC